MENRRGVAQDIAAGKRAAAVAVIANIMSTAVFEGKFIFRGATPHKKASMRVKKDCHIVRLWDE
jgi:hypothetical protein